MTDQLPAPSTVAVKLISPPLVSVNTSEITVPAGSEDVPLIVGVAVLIVPRLLIVMRGAVVSIVPEPVSLPVLPAASVIVAVIV